MFANTPSQLGDFFIAFLGLILEGAPYILIGTVISGFIDAYLPKHVMDRLLPKNRSLAVCVSGMLGAIFPVCECAVVPVIRRLVQKGLPVSCAVTYMLSAPIINPVTFISTRSAFTGLDGMPMYMALSRLGMAYLVTVAVGLIIQRFSTRSILNNKVLEGIEAAKREDEARKKREEKEAAKAAEHAHDDDGGHHHHHHHHDHSHEGSRLVGAMRTAQRDFIDTGMYFTIGVLITSLFNTQINKEFIADVAGNDLIAVPVMMVLAFILSLCSTTDAFVAAALGNSISAAAKLAFLVFGPMFDVKLLFMYASVFRKQFVFWLCLALFLAIGILSIYWTHQLPPPSLLR